MNNCMLVVITFITLVVFFVGLMFNPILTIVAAAIITGICAVILLVNFIVAVTRYIFQSVTRKARGE